MGEIPSAETSINRIVENIHTLIQGNQILSAEIGIVVSEPPDLKIAWNNIILEKEDIYIDQFLLPNYTRKMQGEERLPKAEGTIKTNTRNKKGGHDKPRFISHNHKINAGYKADIKGRYEASSTLVDSGLQAGDLVLIVPIKGGQKFIVISKLIYLPEYRGGSGGKSLD